MKVTKLRLSFDREGLTMQKFRTWTYVAAGIALLTCMTGSAFAQSATTYQYDGRGRLVAVKNGTGAKTTYSHDRADNRITLTTQLQLGTAWEGESLPHQVGYAEANGWAANVTLLPGYLTYGPYTTGVPTGSRVATWRALIDVRDHPDNSPVVTLDVYDATSGQQLAARTLTRHSWAASQAYEVFELPFILDASRAGHALEMRTFYHGAAYARVDKIGYY
jgi:YD repeat-containing protein